MLNFSDTFNDLKVRLVNITVQEYLFVSQVVLGEEPRIAYAVVYDTENYINSLKSEEEDEELMGSYKTKAAALLETQNCKQLYDYISQEYKLDVQSQSSNLSDYKFTGAEVQRLLNNLLHDRSQELSEASVRDILSLIKMMYENGALDSGDAFEQHFITVPKKYDALCPKCNHELYATEGLDIKCPTCGQVFQWSETENRFFPAFTKL